MMEINNDQIMLNLPSWMDKTIWDDKQLKIVNSLADVSEEII